MKTDGHKIDDRDGDDAKTAKKSKQQRDQDADDMKTVTRPRQRVD